MRKASTPPARKTLDESASGQGGRVGVWPGRMRRPLAREDESDSGQGGRVGLWPGRDNRQ